MILAGRKKAKNAKLGYLEVEIDSGRTFSTHVENVVASEDLYSDSRLMSDIGGPRAHCTVSKREMSKKLSKTQEVKISTEWQASWESETKGTCYFLI